MLTWPLLATNRWAQVAQIALIARSYGIADHILFLGASVLTVTLLFDNACNGLARPFFGWVSDHLGRENTMAIAFFIGGVAYGLLGELGERDDRSDPGERAAAGFVRSG